MIQDKMVTCGVLVGIVTLVVGYAPELRAALNKVISRWLQA
jgi:hypothetical protein